MESNSSTFYLCWTHLNSDKFGHFCRRKSTIIKTSIISDSPIILAISLRMQLLFLIGKSSKCFDRSLKLRSRRKSRGLRTSHVTHLLPTWIWKKCVDQLLSLITAIVNRPTNESVMPSCLKRATLIQLGKRAGLDKEDRKKFRPILTLPFVSKHIGKAIARRIEEHLDHNDLNKSYRFAYRRGHSTETPPL